MFEFSCVHCGAPQTAETEELSWVAVCYQCGQLAATKRPRADSVQPHRLPPRPESPARKLRREPAIPPGSSVRKGFGFGVGFSLAVGAFVIVFVGCLLLYCSGALNPTLRAIREDIAGSSRHEQPFVLAMKEDARVDDVVVRVSNWWIGVAPVEDKFGATEFDSPTPAFIVDVVIWTEDRTKRRYYETWQDNRRNDPPAVLKDNFGNVCLRVDHGLRFRVRGHVESGDIESDRAVTDRLVFAKPIAAATELRLSLPGENIGKPGREFRFRFVLPKP